MNNGRFRAVVFDLDGVLWDGEPLYHEAFNVILEEYGKRMTVQDYNQIMGHAVEACWEWVCARFELPYPPSQMIPVYDRAVLKLLRRPVEALPGVIPLLDELRFRGVPLAIASASLRPWVEAVLRGLGLDGSFDAVVSASDVKNGKPAPDLYLAAAAAIGMDPQRCLAVEDSGAGVAAAKAAGMHVVQVRAASTALAPLAQADYVIDDYSRFDLSLIETPAGEPLG